MADSRPAPDRQAASPSAVSLSWATIWAAKDTVAAIFVSFVGSRQVRGFTRLEKTR